MTTPNTPELYQTVVLTFSDGRTASFTGKAAITEKDLELTVVDVAFTPPRPVPEGYHLEELPTKPTV